MTTERIDGYTSFHPRATERKGDTNFKRNAPGTTTKKDDEEIRIGPGADTDIENLKRILKHYLDNGYRGWDFLKDADGDGLPDDPEALEWIKRIARGEQRPPI